MRGFKEKLIYFMRKIPESGKLLKPLEDVIRFKFIPSITGGHISSDDEYKLLSLPTRYGGLAIQLFYEIVSFNERYQKPIKRIPFRKIDQRKTKLDIRSERKQRYKNTLNEPCNDMSESQMRLNNMTQGKEFSTSINNNGFDLNK